MFSSLKLCKEMFVNFWFSTLKIQVCDHLNHMEKSIFQFSVSDLIQLNPIELNIFLLVLMGYTTEWETYFSELLNC